MTQPPINWDKINFIANACKELGPVCVRVATLTKETNNTEDDIIVDYYLDQEVTLTGLRLAIKKGCVEYGFCLLKSRVGLEIPHHGTPVLHIKRKEIQ